MKQCCIFCECLLAMLCIWVSANPRGLDLPHPWERDVAHARWICSSMFTQRRPPSFVRMAGHLTRWRTNVIHWVPFRASFRVAHMRSLSYALDTDTKLGRKQRRDSTQLAPSRKYPLSRELAASGPRGEPIANSRSHVRVRTQIVSPDLCGTLTSGAGRRALAAPRAMSLILLRR